MLGHFAAPQMSTFELKYVSQCTENNDSFDHASVPNVTLGVSRTMPIRGQGGRSPLKKTMLGHFAAPHDPRYVQDNV